MLKTCAFLAGVALAVVLAAPDGAAKGPPGPALAARQKRAQEVLAQLNALDVRFGKVVDSWNGARIDLVANRRALAANRLALRRAQRRARVVTDRLAQRLVAIYESGGTPSFLEVIAGASSIGNLLDRFHAADTVASYDRKLVGQAARVAARLAETRRRLRRTQQRRLDVLHRLDSERGQIGTMLDQRQRLLSSIRSEIAVMKAREARRQEALAAAARARLARARAEARTAAARAAAAKAEAEAAAARTARTRTASAPTTTAAPTTTTDPTPTVAPPASTAPTTSAAPTTTTTAADPSAPPGPGHPEAASIALRYLGVPYRWGGASPDTGFDCSGLVMYVYTQLGIQLPHQAEAQYGYGTPVPRDQLAPGDLVFFDGLSHVGIYIGAGEMVHAPQTGDVVSITPLSQFGGARYVGARRLP
jgi:peptidoglycan DL-endopeptidase CwlO